MEKFDFKKLFKILYLAKTSEPAVVQVPKMKFLMIDGHGDPNTSQEYIDAIHTIYPVAYTLKFMSKKELDMDFTVMPLEGLWWAKDMANFASLDKSEWLWTAMIMQPDFVTEDMFKKACEIVKKKSNPPSLNKLRFDSYEEGRAAQVLYIGAYSDEAPTIESLHSFITDQGGKLGGKVKNHHEIYLSDPRRVPAHKLKTIIRQPF